MSDKPAAHFLPGPTDPAAAKAASRERDADDLASGRKTREQLRVENGAFIFPNMRIVVGRKRVRLR